MTALEPDRDEISRFVEALFRHADPGGFVSLRAFAKNKPWGWPWPVVTGAEVIPAAVRFAARCANAGVGVVFCPPVSTFPRPDSPPTHALINHPALPPPRP